MWNQIPKDILSKIFSFLQPDSIACAASVNNQWHTSTKTIISNGAGASSHPPWFIVMHARNRGHSCYAHNPALNRWYSIPLDFVPVQNRSIASIGSFILYRSSTPSPAQFSLCNPLTKQYSFLPPLIKSRTNPAVGIVEMNTGPGAGRIFRIYVLGGMGENGLYEPTVEMYDSSIGKWSSFGLIPIQYAVRLTVWTSIDSVYSKGVLYWISSARAFTVMCFELCSGTWKNLNVPMLNQLVFAALVRRKGTLTLVSATTQPEACIWELGLEDEWVLVERMPSELGNSFLGYKGSWSSVKCVGNDESLYLYRDLVSEMLVWKEVPNQDKWEWVRVEGFRSSSSQMAKFPIKGVMFHPSLHPSHCLPLGSPSERRP